VSEAVAEEIGDEIGGIFGDFVGGEMRRRTMVLRACGSTTRNKTPPAISSAPSIPLMMTPEIKQATESGLLRRSWPDGKPA